MTDIANTNDNNGYDMAIYGYAAIQHCVLNQFPTLQRKKPNFHPTFPSFSGIFRLSPTSNLRCCRQTTDDAKKVGNMGSSCSNSGDGA